MPKNLAYAGPFRTGEPSGTITKAEMTFHSWQKNSNSLTNKYAKLLGVSWWPEKLKHDRMVSSVSGYYALSLPPTNPARCEGVSSLRRDELSRNNGPRSIQKNNVQCLHSTIFVAFSLCRRMASNFALKDSLLRSSAICLPICHLDSAHHPGSRLLHT